MSLKLVRKLWAIWSALCGIVAILLIGYFIYMHLNPRGRAELPAIQCIDSGGTWNDESKSCIRAS